ncbi:argininosuccinate lyase 2 [Luteitalea sp. TBR-22]|uniref:argininosuccinate lyase n=1 Tax=Luteitalea sp. TBR-22 TaxID=2802971 RepID=UPI001AF34571|nr:argininosuccinate lyase [Luteitalea sp. TBR-22]BCS31241.1 argininosuccinate lyase 2 [Luteitalea sp. TBR-22]
MPSFAPEYVDLVLNDIFEDAKRLFLVQLRAIDYAHLVMLTEQGIVARDAARLIRAGLDRIDEDHVRTVTFDGTYEDLFFYLEQILVDACGHEIAGRLHTARSRNDIDMTMYRMRLRQAVLEAAVAVEELRASLIELAGRHVHTVYAAHTHTQPAQPSTVAHYLLAVVEQLGRDHQRLRAAYASVNRNPLGACAITGTGFPIDRERTSALLGFSGPTGNTYGSIATVDYLLEATSALSVLLVGTGRFVQDLMLWCTAEFGYLRLSDGYVQCSSIMPQKRNPVALEHARALGSKAFAQAQAVAVTVHNTPFGDIVDTEDDLQPLVATAFRDGIRAIRLVAGAMSQATFDVAKMASRAAEGGTTVTELADTLARTHALPFRVSHEVAAHFVAGRRQQPEAPLVAVLDAATTAVLGRTLPYTEEELQHVLSARHFVEVRRTLGGPSPERTTEALAAEAASLSADRAWTTRTRNALLEASRGLREAVEAL